MVFLSLDDVISQQGCAKAALDLAEQMIDPASNMLNVASQYEQLAKRAEHRVGGLVRKLGQVGFGRPHTLMEALSPARAGLFLGAAEVPLVNPRAIQQTALRASIGGNTGIFEVRLP